MVVIDVRRRQAKPQARCLLALALAAVLLTAAVQAADPLALETLAEPMPALALKAAADGATLDNQTLVGKLVLLHFWATWCTPCKAEMAALETFMRLHPDTDLKIYAVTVELEYSASKLKPLQAILHYPIATSVSHAYQIKGGVPTSYIIDRVGILRFAAAGALDEAGFEALVNPLLAQAAPQPAPAAAPTAPPPAP